MIIGIDPGKRGAFALFDPDEWTVATFDMPDTVEGKRELIAAVGKVRAAHLERPYYPRMIGTRNVAVIAQAYGELRACLFFAGVPVIEHAPAAWKKALRLGSDKAASRVLASQTWPDQADQWAQAQHDGRAEAALIALYGWRMHK